MTMFVLLRKELLEQWRTRRLLVLSVVFLFFGLLGPITAKLTPELIKLASASAPGLVFNLPPPAMPDAIAQYIKNLSQMLPLVVLLVTMGSVVGEKERGTLPMVLAKPVGRGAVLAAKYAGLVVTLLVALLLGAVATYYYTQVLFGGLGLGAFAATNLVAALYLLVVLSLAFLASTLARSTVGAGALAFGFWVLLLVAGSLPRIGPHTPTALLNWAAQLGLGQSNGGAWPALWVSVGLIVASFAAAWLRLRREELQ
ncbi:MAG TPA: ABC transporter permease subunit [Anaerolineae bacterium]|nr:ABC transporter permease subunit [Anaerolineae bacterium]HOR00181.1 ABC transporter permease subunit [Anaerolineae bacterium]HPL30054.1 ABC transporter permease subunit [Anaerolineae bacterium]